MCGLNVGISLIMAYSGSTQSEVRAVSMWRRSVIRTFVVLLLSVVFSDSKAALLVFSSTEHQVGAHVVAGSNMDEHLDSTPPHPLPLSTSARATAGVGKHASASGFADEDVLVASAESDSADTDTLGFGGGSFLGTFRAGPGTLGLHFQFDTNGQVFGAGNARSEAKLTVTLMSNNETLYTESFQAPSIVSTSFELPVDSTGSLNLVLVSLTSSSDASASNSSGAHFQLSFAPVPEPSSTLVMLLAIPLVLALLHRSGSRLVGKALHAEGVPDGEPLEAVNRQHAAPRIPPVIGSDQCSGILF